MAKKDQPIDKLGHTLTGYMGNAIRNDLRDTSQSTLTSGKKKEEAAEAFRKESRAVQVNPPAGHPKQAGFPKQTENLAAVVRQHPKAVSETKCQQRKAVMIHEQSVDEGRCRD